MYRVDQLPLELARRIHDVRIGAARGDRVGQLGQRAFEYPRRVEKTPRTMATVTQQRSNNNSVDSRSQANA